MVEAIMYTDFYYDAMEMIDVINNGGDVVALFETKKARSGQHGELVIKYHAYSLIPIIYPLCCEKNEYHAIEWLQSNVKFSNNSARPKLFANMMMKNICVDHIPTKWLLSHGTLEYVCGDFNATQIYAERFPSSFVNDIYDSDVDLTKASSVVARWIWEILASETDMLTFDRIIDIDKTDSDSIKKLVWFISNLTTHEVVHCIWKYLPVSEKVLEVCSDHLDGFMDELSTYKGLPSLSKN